MKIPEVSINKLKLLSGSGLKLIAVISMLADHFAVAFYSAESFLAEPMFSVFGKGITLYFMLRSVGRLAFPLFCFLMAEGFYYTKNSKKYILFPFSVSFPFYNEVVELIKKEFLS